MEKTNTEIVFDLLKNQSLRSGEIQEKTSISRSSLSIILNNLVEEKLIRKVDTMYSIIRTCPQIDDLYDLMVMYHQQRLMDFKYRKLKSFQKYIMVTEWAVNSSNVLKHKVSDYDEDLLLNNLHKASQMFDSYLRYMDNV
jgi:DNA-binding transcriptional regulator GbsR (MarR family)